MNIVARSTQREAQDGVYTLNGANYKIKNGDLYKLTSKWRRLYPFYANEDGAYFQNCGLYIFIDEGGLYTYNKRENWLEDLREAADEEYGKIMNTCVNCGGDSGGCSYCEKCKEEG